MVKTLAVVGTIRGLQFLHQNLGDTCRPCPLLVQHGKAGRLGRKVGRGV